MSSDSSDEEEQKRWNLAHHKKALLSIYGSFLNDSRIDIFCNDSVMLALKNAKNILTSKTGNEKDLADLEQSLWKFREDFYEKIRAAKIKKEKEGPPVIHPQIYSLIESDEENDKEELWDPIAWRMPRRTFTSDKRKSLFSLCDVEKKRKQELHAPLQPSLQPQLYEGAPLQSFNQRMRPNLLLPVFQPICIQAHPHPVLLRHNGGFQHAATFDANPNMLPMNSRMFRPLISSSVQIQQQRPPHDASFSNVLNNSPKRNDINHRVESNLVRPQINGRISTYREYRLNKEKNKSQMKGNQDFQLKRNHSPSGSKSERPSKDQKFDGKSSACRFSPQERHNLPTEKASKACSSLRQSEKNPNNINGIASVSNVVKVSKIVSITAKVAPVQPPIATAPEPEKYPNTSLKTENESLKTCEKTIKSRSPEPEKTQKIALKTENEDLKTCEKMIKSPCRQFNDNAETEIFIKKEIESDDENLNFDRNASTFDICSVDKTKEMIEIEKLLAMKIDIKVEVKTENGLKKNLTKNKQGSLKLRSVSDLMETPSRLTKYQNHVDQSRSDCPKTLANTPRSSLMNGDIMNSAPKNDDEWEIVKMYPAMSPPRNVKS